MVVVPRIVDRNREDVFVFDSHGRRWRSKNTLKVHLSSEDSEDCGCEGCVYSKGRSRRSLGRQKHIV